MTYTTGRHNFHGREGNSRGTRANSKIHRGLRPISLDDLRRLLAEAREQTDSKRRD